MAPSYVRVSASKWLPFACVFPDIDHRKTRARQPQTNGICERFHKTRQGKQPGPDRTWPCLMPPIGGLKRWPPEEASGVFPQIEWLQQPELLCSTLFLFLILYISPDHLRIQPDRIYTIPRRPEMIAPIGFLLQIRKLPKDSNRSPAFHRPQ